MDIFDFHGIRDLRHETLGDPRVCVAVIDGPVALSHACFRGADVTYLEKTPSGVKVGPMTAHGTHVASIIFGQPNGPLQGIAPKCRGILIPMFSEDHRKVSQLSLSEAISKAIEHGAHVVNISSGQLTYFGESEDLLEHAVQAAQKENVLLVAAAGNDRDPRKNRHECLHVPAALPSVLSVGAMDENGSPLEFSCWGPAYLTEGILALGKDVPGAVPGGGIRQRSGTSLAAPIVSGVAALLLSLQLKEGHAPDPHAIRSAILEGAEACDPIEIEDCRPYLAGKLHAVGAIKALSRERIMSEQSESLVIPACDCQTGHQPGEARQELINHSREEAAMRVEEAGTTVAVSSGPLARVRPVVYGRGETAVQLLGTGTPAPVPLGALGRVAPSATSSDSAGGLVFFIGLVGYDFGTEARRDSFKQVMPPVLYNPAAGEFVSTIHADGTKLSDAEIDDLVNRGFNLVPPNPFDPRQMVPYLRAKPDEARSLIWTLNLELTPVYAIEPINGFADRVYNELVNMLDGQSQAEGSKAYVERVSVPAILSGQNVRLFSGQVVSEILVDGTRGMYAWQTSDLIEKALVLFRQLPQPVVPPGRTSANPLTEDEVRKYLRQVLNKLYYQYRNLGITSPDRALNFAATNVFQLAESLVSTLVKGKTLERIDVVKSPYGRIDSDCWDVELKFLDPENTNRAYSVLRFTLDVSDKLPVTLGRLVEYISAT